MLDFMLDFLVRLCVIICLLHSLRTDFKPGTVPLIIVEMHHQHVPACMVLACLHGAGRQARHCFLCRRHTLS